MATKAKATKMPMHDMGGGKMMPGKAHPKAMPMKGEMPPKNMPMKPKDMMMSGKMAPPKGMPMKGKKAKY